MAYSGVNPHTIIQKWVRSTAWSVWATKGSVEGHKSNKSISIHMARQEVCDALSLEKSNNPLSNSKACTGIYPNTTRSTQSSSTYAWSTKNVSRLLEGWMKRDPKWLPQMNCQVKNPCATIIFWGLWRYVSEVFGLEIRDFFMLCWLRIYNRTSMNHAR